VCPASSTASADAHPPEPWRAALRSPADTRRLLAPRSAWAILALAAGDARFAARVADGLDAPEASRARARLKADGLVAMLPLLQARAGRAWCATSNAADLARLFDDPRVLSTGHPAQLQGYVRAGELAALVDEYALHAGPNQLGQNVLLRPVADPWPFADASSSAPTLVQALDLLEAAAEGRAVEPSAAHAAWDLIEQCAARDVPSWYRAARPPRAGPDSRIVVVPSPKRALRAVTPAPATDVDLLAAMLFAVGQSVRRADLLNASGWPPPRLQAAADALIAEPPRGLQVLINGDRLELVSAPAASTLVARLLRRLERGEVLEPLNLPDTVWLVLAIVVLEQPITRAEIAARRLADSDRQVHALLRQRLIREEPRAAVPGRGIPLITTDLVLRRLGVGGLGELQQQLLAATPAAQAENSGDPQP
jgi:chromosome segregation and condensation protein ScpB